MALRGRQTGKITPDDLNTDPITAPVNEDYTLPGHIPTDTIGPSAAEVFAQAGGGDVGFNTDAAVLDRNSIGVVDRQMIEYNEQKFMEARSYAENAAALQSHGVRQYASHEYKHQLKNIVEEANKLPMPDITTTIDGQRMVLPPEVKTVPLKLDREEACRLLATFIGKEAVIEVISCARTCGPTFAIPQRGNPKAGNPLLWLSPQMAVETRKRDVYDKIPKDIPFDETIDGNEQHGVFAAVARLFSAETARNIQVIARVNHTNVLAVLRFLVDKICKDRRAVVNPPEGALSEFLDIKTESMAHAISPVGS
jgi:hypothetical protein